MPEQNDKSLFLCGAGKTSFHIDSCGRLSMCISNRNPEYDIRTGSFEDGWEKVMPQLTSRQHSANFPCAGCRLRPLCPQCPAYGDLEYKDAEARVEYLCQLTKIRFAAFCGAM